MAARKRIDAARKECTISNRSSYAMDNRELGLCDWYGIVTDSGRMAAGKQFVALCRNALPEGSAEREDLDRYLQASYENDVSAELAEIVALIGYSLSAIDEIPVDFAVTTAAIRHNISSQLLPFVHAARAIDNPTLKESMFNVADKILSILGDKPIER